MLPFRLLLVVVFFGQQQGNLSRWSSDDVEKNRSGARWAAGWARRALLWDELTGWSTSTVLQYWYHAVLRVLPYNLHRNIRQHVKRFIFLLCSRRSSVAAPAARFLCAYNLPFSSRCSYSSIYLVAVKIENSSKSTFTSFLSHFTFHHILAQCPPLLTKTTWLRVTLF